MPLITRSSQNANVKLGTTAQLAAISFADGDLASDTTLDKLQLFDGSALVDVGQPSFSGGAVVSQSTTIGDYTTPTSAVASSSGLVITQYEYFVLGGGGSGGFAPTGNGGNSGSLSTGNAYAALGSLAVTVGAGGIGYSAGSGAASSIGSISAAGGTNSNNGGGNGLGANGGTKVVVGGVGTNGVGGAGIANSITGSSVTYGGGGGGGGDRSSPNSITSMVGGSGGGGNGGVSEFAGSPVAGTANLGAGGGGGGRRNTGVTIDGADGGSGVVILRYLTGSITATGGTITTSGGYTIHQFNSSGTFTITAFTGAGALTIDNNVATKWYSTSEANPNIYVDMGSALNLCAAAFYFDSIGTTNTQILIQTSINGTDWTTKRTITESNLTDGAYNYYRFNIAGGARYVRFYGNSAGSTVLSIYEIKIMSKTDAQIFNDLGMLLITGSDTSLGPDGT